MKAALYVTVLDEKMFPRILTALAELQLGIWPVQNIEDGTSKYISKNEGADSILVMIGVTPQEGADAREIFRTMLDAFHKHNVLNHSVVMNFFDGPVPGLVSTMSCPGNIPSKKVEEDNG